MIFQDNVIKEYLKNVYFITGTPCGGKTTISREIGKRHNLFVYDVDEQFSNHLKLSNSNDQSAMNKDFQDADEFFGRSVEEYRKWLLENTREQLDFILLDLIRLSQNQKIICDCHLNLNQAKQITESERIVFLIKDPTNIIEDYCNRKDHQDFNEFINSATNPNQAKKTCNETLRSINELYYNDIKKSIYFWYERTKESTIDEAVQKVEQYLNI
ncbi:AAA family ATPase [Floccifex sp.]|uniref:AAA family ATPase n=1 Tax=Floccifex sp. TaxID=2815810 RepID=UPI003F062D71